MNGRSCPGAMAELKFTLILKIPTAPAHAMGQSGVLTLRLALWVPEAVPVHAPVPHLTCDNQVPRSTEGRAPHPVALVPVLIPTSVLPCAPQGNIQQHGVAQLPMLGFQAVLLHPILAEDNSGSR